MPRVSVVIPTYNRANFLAEAINSVLKQSFQDLEIIVVDDGSTDGTADRVASFNGSIRYIRLEHNARPGLLRNQGISAARGEFIAFLDDDDLWHPNKLEQQIGLLDTSESLGFTYSDICLLYPDRSITGPMLSPQHKQVDILFDRLLENCFIYPSTVVVRRRLLDRLGLFDDSLPIGEDYDLWLRLAYASKAGYAPTPLVYIRRHPSSNSHRYGIVIFQNTILVLERTMGALPLTPRQKLRGRKNLSHLYTLAGRAALELGHTAEARQYLLRSLRLNPLQSRAWTSLKHSYRLKDQ